MYIYLFLFLRNKTWFVYSKKVKQKTKSAVKSCYATDTFSHCVLTEPESTRTQQQHVVFEQAERNTEREGGRFALLNIYSVLLNREHEWLNENQTKKDGCRFIVGRRSRG